MYLSEHQDDEPTITKRPRRRVPRCPETDEDMLTYIACARCRSKNAPENRFCGKCGGNLWEPCIACGHMNSTNERFCGNCGCNQQVELRRRSLEFKRLIENAEEAIAEARFSEAMAILHPILECKQALLHEFIAQAQELSSISVHRRYERVAAVQIIESEVKLLMAKEEPDAAYQRALTIPEEMRSADIKRFMEEQAKRQAEIEVVQREVREFAGKPLTLDVIPMLEKLLEHKPDDLEGRVLASRLCAAILEKANPFVRQGDFESAKKIADHLPDSLATDDFLRWKDRVTNVAHWARELRHAPRLEPMLFAWSRKMAFVAAKYPELTAASEKLFQQEKLVAANPAASRMWVMPPQKSALGPPLAVTELGAIFDIERPENVAEVFAAPARFAVAAGLALQGVGLASYDVNLYPEATTWRGRLSKMLSKTKADAVWGLDLSASGLKGIKMQWSGRKNDRPRIEDCVLIEHRRSLAHATHEEDRGNLIATTMNQFQERFPHQDAPLVLGLPHWSVMFKSVEFPPMPAVKLDAAIEHEMKRLFPIPFQELVCKSIPTGTKESREKSRSVVHFLGLRREGVKSIVDRIDTRRAKVFLVQSELIAICNLLAYLHFSPLDEKTPRDDAKQAVAAVDLGADHANVVFCMPNQFFIRSFQHGSDRINKSLVREFQLTYAQSEEWKRNPLLAPNPGKFLDALSPIYDEYLQESATALRNMSSSAGNVSVVRAYGLGGGFSMPGLHRYFLYNR